MKKFFSLLCAVLVTTLVFGQSYGILVNGSTYFAGEPAGEYEGFNQYLAHVQLQQGDYCQLYDADNKAAWAVTLNSYSVEGFTLNNDRYEVAVDGCYDFYIKLKYQADELYIGAGSNCGEGVDISGGEEAEMTTIYDWAGEVGTTIPGASGVEISTVKIHNNADQIPAIKFGSSYVYAEGKWLAIKPAEGGFKAGDVVSVAAVFSNDATDGSKYAQVDIYAADGATRLMRGEPVVNGKKTADDPVIETLVLEADQDSLFLGRYGNTGMFVTLLKVERAAGDTPEPPVETPKFYITGESLVGSWEPNALPSYEDTYVFENLAAGSYMMKITLKGNWNEGVLGYDALTGEIPAGITRGEGDNNDNICFTLAEAGDVTVTYTAESFTIAGNFYVAPTPDPTVAVMGSMNDWAAEIPFVLSDDKTYASLTVENIGAGEYNFKFIINGEWRSNGYTYHRGFPGAAGITENNEADMIFQADVDGEYSFYWYFANDSAAIVYPEAPVVIPAKFYLTGDSALVVDAGLEADKAWTPAAIKAETDTMTLTLLAKQEYKLKITLDGDWATGKGYSSLSEKPEGVSSDNDDNIIFSLVDAGEVDVIYVATEDTTIFKVEGNFYVAPTPDPTVAVMGSMNNWAEEIPFVLSDDKSYASLTVENIGADNYEFKFVINGEWRSNGYTYHRGFPGAAGITENNEANMIFQADVDGEYTFYWYFANDSAAIIYPEKEEPALTNGYYLVGSMNEWTPAAENLFEVNPETEGEYQLAINLDENDQIKVVYVENDAIVTWFPAEGENYVVDHNHAGPTMMYFRPDYYGDWAAFGGYFYIDPTDHVAIDNIDANAPAVKILRDGQILIIKGDKTFNAQGQIVK